MKSYTALADFTNDLDQVGPQFPLKIMGGHQPTTASMLAVVFNDVAWSSTNNNWPLQAPFGRIEKRGASVDGDKAYTVSIRKNSNNHNIFQGDVVESSSDLAAHKFSMVISQTCDTPVDQSPELSCARSI